MLAGVLLLFNTVSASSQNYAAIAFQAYYAGDYRTAAEQFDNASKNDWDRVKKGEYYDLAEKCRRCLILAEDAKNAFDAAHDIEGYKLAQEKYQLVLDQNPDDSSAKAAIEICKARIKEINNRAEQERLAREQAEQQRQAEERERQAREQAERERLAREQAEQERLAIEQAEKDRLAREQAERQAQTLEQTQIEQTPAETESIKPERVQQDAVHQEQRTWAYAKAKNTWSAYETYLSKYPDGVYADEAKAAVQRFKDEDDAAERRRQEENKWSSASRTNTEASYKSYIEAYPQGRYVYSARSAIAQIKERERQARPWNRMVAYFRDSDYWNYGERLRFLIGTELLAGWSYLDVQCPDPYCYYCDGLYSACSVVLGVGGHTNRINMVASYDFFNNGITLRPQWNIVRKKDTRSSNDSLYPSAFSGDYSQFYLYVAPELSYSFAPEGRYYKFDSGVRLGIGFMFAEFIVGYAFRERALYMGTSIYIGFD